MGSGISRTGSGGHCIPAGPRQRRSPRIRRTISSICACGDPSFFREKEDCPTEFMASSAEHSCQKKLGFAVKNSDMSLGNGEDLVSIKTESMVPSGRYLAAHENPALKVGTSNVELGNEGKCMSENRHLFPPHQSIDSSRGNKTASSSDLNQPSPCTASENEMCGMDAMNDGNCKINGDSVQIDKGLNNSSTVHSGHLGEPLLDEASVENNVSEEVDFSNSDLSNSSFASGSPLDFRLLRQDVIREVSPTRLGFVVSEREQNREDGSLLQVDVLSMSCNVSPANSAEISSQDARRNSRRLFWDAFSRRNSRGHIDSRTSVLSPGDSGSLRSHDRPLDLSGGDESTTPGSNELQRNSRSEIWERLHGTLDSIDRPTVVCPRGIHGDGSCSCSSSSAEESDAHAGISRIVMLAEALFEVLDQIHRHPMSLSLSIVSLPAPESVVDSFPVKTHCKNAGLESADVVSQCYICLAEYEEGDKIRVLPCHHEYHMSCVDKWLKEIHGICPLCRGDVHVDSTEG